VKRSFKLLNRCRFPGLLILINPKFCGPGKYLIGAHGVVNTQQDVAELRYPSHNLAKARSSSIWSRNTVFAPIGDHKRPTKETSSDYVIIQLADKFGDEQCNMARRFFPFFVVQSSAKPVQSRWCGKGPRVTGYLWDSIHEGNRPQIDCVGDTRGWHYMRRD